jgi:TrwC relaxase
MLSLSSGHSADYLTSAVAVGRESYYTGAVAAGEPPGRWHGRGAEQLGLAGEVDAQDMTALYEHFMDPRDPAFRDPSRWENAERVVHRRHVQRPKVRHGVACGVRGAGGVQPSCWSTGRRTGRRWRRRCGPATTPPWTT